MTLRTALHVATSAPLVSSLPWPYGAIELAAGLIPKSPRTKRTTVYLESATAELIRASGVPHDAGRVILYFHGGAFLTCGQNTHSALITRLSKESGAPVLSVNYRMIPNSLRESISDCLEGYLWLRRHYQPEQIVLAGDSAGGYLALAVATHLAGLETPAALVLMSPLLQLDPKGKTGHPNIRCDAMFSAIAFDALTQLLERANDGVLYEPLDDLREEMPPTLIHVSGHEVLVHDAVLAEEYLSKLGVPVEVVIWPGQIHVFQIAAFVPEAKRSLEQMGRFIIDATEKTSEKTALKLLTDRTATVG